MISVAEAKSIIMECRIPMAHEPVLLEKATGRILAEDVFADRDFPPFDRVMMDGIAIDWACWEAGIQEFEVIAMQTAGAMPRSLTGSGTCIEVMTGAMLPFKADTVVRYEDITIDDGRAIINVSALKQGQNVHLTGIDRKEGSLLIKAPTPIGPPTAGVLATVGKASVQVKAMPRVAVVSTGDELVDVNEKPLPYQIRTSNTHTIAAALQQLGIEANTYHINDDRKALEAKLAQVFHYEDVVILSGGVSKGKKDFVPEVLEALGVEKCFHRVAQRPGKPFWFGKVGHEKAVFALPGNPVSTFMCYCQYIRPWILDNWGVQHPQQWAILAEPITFKPDLDYFLQVMVQPGENLVPTATPVQGKGSGDLANMLQSNAFLHLPKGQEHFEAGKPYTLIPFEGIV